MPDAIVLAIYDMHSKRATHQINVAIGIDIRRHEDFRLSAFDCCCLQAFERAETVAESDECIIVEVLVGKYQHHVFVLGCLRLSKSISR